MSIPALDQLLPLLRTLEAENERLRDSMRALLEKVGTAAQCRNCLRPVAVVYPLNSEVRHLYDIDGRPHYTTCRYPRVERLKESL